MSIAGVGCIYNFPCVCSFLVVLYIGKRCSYWINEIIIYSLLQISSSINNYVQSREYPYPSWQQVHIMVGVGREIRKIILPPSDDGVLESKWSFRAPCWWVIHREETTGSKIPLACVAVSIMLFPWQGALRHRQWLSKILPIGKLHILITLVTLVILNGFHIAKLLHITGL